MKRLRMRISIDNRHPTNLDTGSGSWNNVVVVSSSPPSTKEAPKTSSRSQYRPSVRSPSSLMYTSVGCTSADVGVIAVTNDQPVVVCGRLMSVSNDS